VKKKAMTDAINVPNAPGSGSEIAEANRINPPRAGMGKAAMAPKKHPSFTTNALGSSREITRWTRTYMRLMGHMNFDVSQSCMVEQKMARKWSNAHERWRYILSHVPRFIPPLK